MFGSVRAAILPRTAGLLRPNVTHTSHLSRRCLLQAQTSVTSVQRRWFNLHEYKSMRLFNKFQVDVPKNQIARTADEAATMMRLVSDEDCVVKAQVLAGGRGKGVFTSGFQGGVHVAQTPEEAKQIARSMIGENLVTKQTGPEGKPCKEVLIAERLFLRRETYFAILMDRAAGGPVMVASPSGGMDIEAVAQKTPDLIFKEPIDIDNGPTTEQLERIAENIGFTKEPTKQAAIDNFRRLYELFIKKDCTLLEINPFAETHDHRVLAIDAKLNFDDNAKYRQADLCDMIDETQVDAREARAERAGLNYIPLDGNIGCLVNGAGLAMATMDVIKLEGGEPANFLDLGGGASESVVVEAFSLLNEDPQVKAVLVNIFGGIVRCDHIALGLIRAAAETGLKKPVVVRLQGTNVEEAAALIEDSGLRMLTAKNLDDAAQKVVRVVKILEMAEKVDVKVNFELPI